MGHIEEQMFNEAGVQINFYRLESELVITGIHYPTSHSGTSRPADAFRSFRREQLDESIQQITVVAPDRSGVSNRSIAEWLPRCSGIEHWDWTIGIQSDKVDVQNSDPVFLRGGRPE